MIDSVLRLDFIPRLYKVRDPNAEGGERTATGLQLQVGTSTFDELAALQRENAKLRRENAELLREKEAVEEEREHYYEQVILLEEGKILDPQTREFVRCRCGRRMDYVDDCRRCPDCG